MVYFAVALVLLAMVASADLLIQFFFRFRTGPHEATPLDAGIAFEEVFFPTASGGDLFGWWVPAAGEEERALPVVVLVHGWGRDMQRMLPYIHALHPLGYDLLAFDLRGHGRSDPDRFPNLLKFSEDIRAAVSFLQDQRRGGGEDGRVAVIGHSAGGSATLHAAAMDERIGAAVTIGAFAHPADIMQWDLAHGRPLLAPLVWLLIKYLQIRMRVNFDRIAPVNLIGRARARILLIHGEQDEVVPIEHGERLRSAADPERTMLWRIPDRAHSDCHLAPGFWTCVDSLLQGGGLKEMRECAMAERDVTEGVSGQ